MERFTYSSEMPASAKRLYEWHASPGAFARLLPPWRKTEVLHHSPRLEEGSEVHMRLHWGLCRAKACHRVTLCEPGIRFCDEQIKGALASWWHEHRMRTVSEERSLLEDSIEYELPGWAKWSRGEIDQELKRLFAYRHRVTRADLACLSRYPTEPLRILLSGSSGLIGSALAAFLECGGHTVIRLVRRTAGEGEAEWSPERGVIDLDRIEGCDAVIHLAGENIAGRWTHAKKERVKASRIEGTRSLISSLAQLQAPPKTLLCSSAIGYYGEPGEDAITEAAPNGTGWLAEVCREWEEVTLGFPGRTVLMRTGLVLSLAGGALRRMITPFRCGVGGVVGSGKQGVSWITLDDMIYQIYHLLLSPSAEGAYNLVAPHPITNQQFTKSLAQAIDRPAFLPFPTPMVRLLLGEMGVELLTKGAFISPQRLTEGGSLFYYPSIDGALHHLLGL
jgi:uncharacterized protein